YTCDIAADHPALHSFPTRRSSDLLLGTAFASAARREGPRARVAHRIHSPHRACRDRPAAHRTRPSPPLRQCVAPDRLALEVWGRSEEHTSELQSRENLVCRLLLEK